MKPELLGNLTNLKKVGELRGTLPIEPAKRDRCCDDRTSVYVYQQSPLTILITVRDSIFADQGNSNSNRLRANDRNC